MKIHKYKNIILFLILIIIISLVIYINLKKIIPTKENFDIGKKKCNTQFNTGIWMERVNDFGTLKFVHKGGMETAPDYPIRVYMNGPLNNADREAGINRLFVVGRDPVDTSDGVGPTGEAGWVPGRGWKASYYPHNIVLPITTDGKTILDDGEHYLITKGDFDSAQQHDGNFENRVRNFANARKYKNSRKQYGHYEFVKKANFTGYSCNVDYTSALTEKGFFESCPQKDRLEILKDVIPNAFSSITTCNDLKSTVGCKSLLEYDTSDVSATSCYNNYGVRTGKSKCEDKLVDYFCQKTCKGCDKKMAIVGEYLFFERDGKGTIQHFSNHNMPTDKIMIIFQRNDDVITKLQSDTEAERIAYQSTEEYKTNPHKFFHWNRDTFENVPVLNQSINFEIAKNPKDHTENLGKIKYIAKQGATTSNRFGILNGNYLDPNKNLSYSDRIGWMTENMENPDRGYMLAANIKGHGLFERMYNTFINLRFKDIGNHPYSNWIKFYNQEKMVENVEVDGKTMMFADMFDLIYIDILPYTETFSSNFKNKIRNTTAGIITSDPELAKYLGLGLKEGPSVKRMRSDPDNIKQYCDLKLKMTDDKGYDPSKCLTAFKKNITIDANNKTDVIIPLGEYTDFRYFPETADFLDKIEGNAKITSLAGVNYNATIVAKNKLNGPAIVALEKNMPFKINLDDGSVISESTKGRRVFLFTGYPAKDHSLESDKLQFRRISRLRYDTIRNLSKNGFKLIENALNWAGGPCGKDNPKETRLVNSNWNRDSDDCVAVTPQAYPPSMPFDPAKTTYSFKKISDFDRRAPDSKGGNKWLSHNGADESHLKTDGLTKGIPYPAVRVVNKNNPHEYYLGTWGGTNMSSPAPAEKDFKFNIYVNFLEGNNDYFYNEDTKKNVRLVFTDTTDIGRKAKFEFSLADFYVDFILNEPSPFTAPPTPAPAGGEAGVSTSAPTSGPTLAPRTCTNNLGSVNYFDGLTDRLYAECGSDSDSEAKNLCFNYNNVRLHCPQTCNTIFKNPSNEMQDKIQLLPSICNDI